MPRDLFAAGGSMNSDEIDLASQLFTSDNDFTDGHMSVAEQSEYQNFLHNMLAASRPVSASKQPANAPQSSGLSDNGAPRADDQGPPTTPETPASSSHAEATPTPTSSRGLVLASPMDSAGGSSTIEGWEEELLDEVDVLGRQKEQVQRENERLRQQLAWSERTVQELRTERNQALTQLARQEALQEQRVVEQSPAPSDLEMQLIRAKMELAQNFEEIENLGHHKRTLERELKERNVELQQAQSAKDTAEEASFQLARALAEVKTRYAQEQAAREDAEVTMEHAVHAKLEAQAQLEEYRDRDKELRQQQHNMAR